MSQFLKKQCKICAKTRKFLRGSERDKCSICGECWDWDEDKAREELEKSIAEDL